MIITLHQQVGVTVLSSLSARARAPLREREAGPGRDNFLMQHNWNASNHDASSCPLTTLQSRTHLFNAYAHRQFAEENLRLPCLPDKDIMLAVACLSPLFWGFGE